MKEMLFIDFLAVPGDHDSLMGTSSRAQWNKTNESLHMHVLL